MPVGKNGEGLQGGGATLDVRRGPTLSVQTVGWQPTCTHGKEPVPCTVLDPFAGAGTALLVAAKNGRNAVGIELQEDYVPLIEARLRPFELDLVHPIESRVERVTHRVG